MSNPTNSLNQRLGTPVSTIGPLMFIAISLKRIADALERPAARDNAPIGNRGEPIMPGPRGWEVKS